MKESEVIQYSYYYCYIYTRRERAKLLYFETYSLPLSMEYTVLAPVSSRHFNCFVTRFFFHM